MDHRPTPETPPGVKIRRLVGGDRIQIAFTTPSDGECRELLPPGPVNKWSLQRAALLREEIRRKIKEGTFEYEAYFPDCPRAVVAPSKSKRMEALLQRQLEAYEH